jgi:Enoyl-(Acyl carrier protein) reductase
VRRNTISEQKTRVGQIRTEPHGHVFKIIIDNRAKKNSFSPQMMEQISDAFTTLDRTNEYWVGVLCAEGSDFTAGGWGQHGITVNALAPGFFASKMTAGTIKAMGLEKLTAGVPLRRIGDEDDLKGAVVLLASDAGKHITGQSLAVDGGVSPVCFERASRKNPYPPRPS